MNKLGGKFLILYVANHVWQQEITWRFHFVVNMCYLNQKFC